MGITTLNRKNWYGPSLTLGGGEVRPLDLAFAYTVFANNGKLRGQVKPPERQQPGFAELEPVTILKVEDANGNVLEEFTGPDERTNATSRSASGISSPGLTIKPLPGVISGRGVGFAAGRAGAASRGRRVAARGW